MTGRCLSICRDPSKTFKSGGCVDRERVAKGDRRECENKELLYDMGKEKCIECPKYEGQYWSSSKQRCKRIFKQLCYSFGRVWKPYEIDSYNKIVQGKCLTKCRNTRYQVSQPRGRCKLF